MNTGDIIATILSVLAIWQSFYYYKKSKTINVKTLMLHDQMQNDLVAIQKRQKQIKTFRLGKDELLLQKRDVYTENSNLDIYATINSIDKLVKNIYMERLDEFLTSSSTRKTTLTFRRALDECDYDYIYHIFDKLYDQGIIARLQLIE